MAPEQPKSRDGLHCGSASTTRVATSSPFGTPTPIPISRLTKRLVSLAIVAAFALLVWAVPAVLWLALGGFALALILSFPVRLFSRVMPRSLAIFLAFIILIAALLLISYVLVPLFLTQSGALISALPQLIENLEGFLVKSLEALDRRDLLPSSPELIAARLGEDLRTSLSLVSRNIVGNTVGLVFGTMSFAVALFAVAFVAASLLANVRDYKAAFLASVPGQYRRDAQQLWNDLARALSRYLGGLALVLAIQGALSAAALHLIGMPYALALGAWVSLTAVIPYLGAWIGAVPALLVAFSISGNAVFLTAVVFLVIQQIEGNVLTPRIQGQTIRVPSVIVFLAVIAGGTLWGLSGILFAVPALAVIRVLFDFFRVRLRVV